MVPIGQFTSDGVRLIKKDSILLGIVMAWVFNPFGVTNVRTKKLCGTDLSI